MKAKIIGNNIHIGKGEDLIHYNHSIPTTLDEIEDDVWEPYVVYEGYSNWPILHGLMAEDKDIALQEIADIAGIDTNDLFAVNKLKFN